MSLSILIPYKADLERERLFKVTLQRYQRHFPEAQICIGENNDEPYNRSRARNAAFQAATGDTLIIADADTVGNPYHIQAAIDHVCLHGGWALPYDQRGYYNLTQNYTQNVLGIGDGPLPPREALQYDHELESWAGIVIVPREGYETVGGYDERFKGYGYEDNAFSIALNNLWGPMWRTEDAYILHLWHSRPNGDSFAHPFLTHNQDLSFRYKFLDGHRDAMRSFVDARLQGR